MRKRMCNSPKLDLVNMNAYIEVGENLSICSQDIERQQNSGLDIVNMNAYIEVGENLSIFSQDIEWKQNSGVNQGP